MIAVPDYPKDEVANWGLLKFSENHLLFKASENSAMDQKRVVSSIASSVSQLVRINYSKI